MRGGQTNFANFTDFTNFINFVYFKSFEFGKGKQGEGERVKGEKWQARASETKLRVEGRESKRRVTIKYSLHLHPSVYNFFPRAIAPFTGIGYI